MTETSLFDVLPLSLFFPVTFLLSLLVSEAGYRYGLRCRSRGLAEKTEISGTLLASALGLVALLLAFTFNVVSSRYEDKRKTMHDEVNAIGTTYLRADLLPKPQNGEIKALLRDYADARLQAARDGEFRLGVVKSEELQAKIWKTSIEASGQQPPSVYVSLYFQSLNEMIDLHTKRMIAALHSRTPDAILLVLFGATFIAFLATGYHGGIAGARRSPLAILIALLFSAVLWLIFDIERAHQGSMRVEQTPMQELRNSMK